MVYFRKLLACIDEPEDGPSPLATDSQSARDDSYNPQHHDRMKHVQRRHFFVRDVVESFELEVPFVRTADKKFGDGSDESWAREQGQDTNHRL